jgi:hypothetical protein
VSLPDLGQNLELVGFAALVLDGRGARSPAHRARDRRGQGRRRPCRGGVARSATKRGTEAGRGRGASSSGSYRRRCCTLLRIVIDRSHATGVHRARHRKGASRAGGARRSPAPAAPPPGPGPSRRCPQRGRARELRAGASAPRARSSGTLRGRAAPSPARRALEVALGRQRRTRARPAARWSTLTPAGRRARCPIPVRSSAAGTSRSSRSSSTPAARPRRRRAARPPPPRRWNRSAPGRRRGLEPQRSYPLAVQRRDPRAPSAERPGKGAGS